MCIINFKTRCSSMAKIQSAKVSDVARAFGFPHILRNCYTLFDFHVTRGTYDNQTWTKMFRKNFKKFVCPMSIVLLFRSEAGYDAHRQIMLLLPIRRAGSRPSRNPDRVAPALLGFPVTLNNVNMVIQRSIIFLFQLSELIIKVIPHVQINSFVFSFRYSFICQGTSTRRQRSDLFGLRVKLNPVKVPCPKTQQ